MFGWGDVIVVLYDVLVVGLVLGLVVWCYVYVCEVMV